MLTIFTSLMLPRLHRSALALIIYLTAQAKEKPVSIRKNQTVTIRDIAKLANVSYQAVSLVINDRPGVSDETRKRIKQLIRDLDYRPNKAAQMLNTSHSKMLELVLVDIQYAGRLADSIQNMANTAKKYGYSLLVSGTSSTDLDKAAASAASRLVDGIILYAPRLKVTDEELRRACGDIPLVRRDYLPGSKIPWVGFDQVHATRLAVEHLIDLGHRHIAAISPTADILNGYWRGTAWRNVLLEHGLEPGPVAEGDYSMKSGYDAAQLILQDGRPFSGLVIGTDSMAIGAIRALRDHGLRVPDDVSIVSFDNTEFAVYVEPALTSVDFKFVKQDEMVVTYLLDMLKDPEMEPHHRVLFPDFVVRESTRRL
jgi:DNA-binding LacI/PurR family transcriptional regulator